MNERYARGDTYAGDDRYGGDDAFGRDDAYGGRDAYGRGGANGRGEAYAGRDAYGRGGANGRGEAYAGRDAYGRGPAHGRGDAYGQDHAYAGRDVRARDDGHGRGQKPVRLGAYAREQIYVGLKAKARRDGKELTGRAGGFIIAFVALFSAVVVIVGLGYAAGAGARRRVLLAQGDCAPVASLNTRGLDCTLESQLAQQYTHMIAPVYSQMKTYAAAYAASEFQNLPAAQGALTAEVAALTSLESGLKQFTFPPVFAAATNKLIGDNEALIKLTAKQAQSSSLAQLQSFDGQVQAGGNTVRADVTLVGQDLAKPPTPNEFIGNGG